MFVSNGHSRVFVRFSQRMSTPFAMKLFNCCIRAVVSYKALGISGGFRMTEALRGEGAIGKSRGWTSRQAGVLPRNIFNKSKHYIKL